jgi:hypothetical protein
MVTGIQKPAVATAAQVAPPLATAMQSGLMPRMSGRYAPYALAALEREEMAGLSSLRTVGPRELPHQPPIEVIFCMYTREAAPPQFRPRAAKHTVSR